jgi:hypothetical protein
MLPVVRRALASASEQTVAQVPLFRRLTTCLCLDVLLHVSV